MIHGSRRSGLAAWAGAVVVYAGFIVVGTRTLGPEDLSLQFFVSPHLSRDSALAHLLSVVSKLSTREPIVWARGSPRMSLMLLTHVLDVLHARPRRSWSGDWEERVGEGKRNGLTRSVSVLLSRARRSLPLRTPFLSCPPISDTPPRPALQVDIRLQRERQPSSCRCRGRLCSPAGVQASMQGNGHAKFICTDPSQYKSQI